jgi:hypothetical protein
MLRPAPIRGSPSRYISQRGGVQFERDSPVGSIGVLMFSVYVYIGVDAMIRPRFTLDNPLGRA